MSIAFHKDKETHIVQTCILTSTGSSSDAKRINSQGAKRCQSVKKMLQRWTF